MFLLHVVVSLVVDLLCTDGPTGSCFVSRGPVVYRQTDRHDVQSVPACSKHVRRFPPPEGQGRPAGGVDRYNTGRRCKTE